MSLCSLDFLVRQVRVTVGRSGLHRCVLCWVVLIPFVCWLCSGLEGDQDVAECRGYLQDQVCNQVWHTDLRWQGPALRTHGGNCRWYYHCRAHEIPSCILVLPCCEWSYMLTSLNCYNMPPLRLACFTRLLISSCWKSNATNARLMAFTLSLWTLHLELPQVWHCSTFQSSKTKLNTVFFLVFFLNSTSTTANYSS